MGWFVLGWGFFTIFEAYWFITEPDWRGGLTFAGNSLLLVLLALNWRNHERPVLEIREDEIRYARFQFLPQRRVPIHEIAGIQIARWKRATIRLRSGRSLVVNLKLIEGIDRERAARALERAARSAPV
jgi:hypothetical protein